MYKYIHFSCKYRTNRDTCRIGGFVGDTNASSNKLGPGHYGKYKICIFFGFYKCYYN